MKLLTCRGVLVEEEGSSYLADGDADSDDARTLRSLQAAGCAYRIAFGPQAGQKAFSPACGSKKRGNSAMHDLQNRGRQLRLRREQQTQRDRQRQHPLAYRHMRDDVVDQVSSGLCHAPRAA